MTCASGPTLPTRHAVCTQASSVPFRAVACRASRLSSVREQPVLWTRFGYWACESMPHIRRVCSVFQKEAVSAVELLHAQKYFRHTAQLRRWTHGRIFSHRSSATTKTIRETRGAVLKNEVACHLFIQFRLVYTHSRARPHLIAGRNFLDFILHGPRGGTPSSSSSS